MSFNGDRLLLAHELGTSGNKATLFTEAGELVKSTTASYPTQYLSGGRAEQDPSHWWSAVCTTTRQLLEGIEADRIASVAFSGQMNGCLPVDGRGRPLRPHIIYSDSRAELQAQQLIDRIGFDKIYEITGHRPSSAYTLEKIMWIRDNEPEIFKQTAWFLNAKDYMNLMLTGRAVTDQNDASATNAFDLFCMCWSDEILMAAGIDKSLLPEVVPSPTIIGEITSEAAKATGLKAGTPVAAGAGDGGCATVGAGSISPGKTYNYLGSSSWIATTSEIPAQDPGKVTFTFAHPVPGYLMPCGTVQTAGSAYEWARNEIAGGGDYAELDRLIKASPPGARGLLFLPHLMGERSPRWNPDAKGSFIGMTLEHSRGDLLRSVLEGVALNMDVILRILQSTQDIDEIAIIGGGAQGVVYRQILADVYGIPLVYPVHLEEATSMGAALIGGVAAGVFSGFHAVDRFIEENGRTDPNIGLKDLYGKKKPLIDQAYEALEPLFSKLES